MHRINLPEKRVNPCPKNMGLSCLETAWTSQLNFLRKGISCFSGIFIFGSRLSKWLFLDDNQLPSLFSVKYSYKTLEKRLFKLRYYSIHRQSPILSMAVWCIYKIGSSTIDIYTQEFRIVMVLSTFGDFWRIVQTPYYYFIQSTKSHTNKDGL